MKRIMTTMVAAAMFSAVATAQAPAFPGAEGFARYTTTGGRGGKVLHVTNLNDSGTGSLREALQNTSGKRIIVFDVSGTIALKSNLIIKYGDVTIEGQTAPGDGITIRDYSLENKASNVIVRFIRVRRGNAVDVNDGADAFWGKNRSNIIIDHCSLSWSIDETASFYDNKNFTMQWCTIAESLNNAGHEKGAHGYGGIWGGKSASFHHNLLAHHTNRCPRLNGARYGWGGSAADNYASSILAEQVDLRNNVMYNWGQGNGAYAGMGGYHNIVNNYYKYGPATKNKYRVFQCGHTSNASGEVIPVNTYGHFYINGNYVRDKGENYDWNGVIVDDGNTTVWDTIRLSEPIPSGTVTTHSAQKAFDKVLAYAGASYKRDAVDVRYADEAKNGTATYKGSVTKLAGIIDTQDDVQGWPTLKSKVKLTDSDNDGMPDIWETANGLNPNDAADASTYTIDKKGYYTNIEVYCNALVEDLMKAGNTDAIDAVDEYYPETQKVEGIPYYDGSAAEGGYDNEPDEPEPPVNPGDNETVSYTLSQTTYKESTATGTWSFSNGFTVSNNNSKAYQTGQENGIKYSANVQYTIGIPEDATLDSLTFEGYDNYQEVDAYLGELAGETFDATSYVFPQKDADGNYTVASHTVVLDQPATDYITFTPKGKQVVWVITLFGSKQASGISAISDGQDEQPAYYTTQGIRTLSPRKGVAIVKTGQKAVKKVI